MTRRTDRRVLGGVASGIAAYFDIDPLIVRLALVAFGFVTGPLAVLLYLIAWAIVPAFPGTPPRKVSVGVWVAIALLLGILFAGGAGSMWFAPGFGGPGFDGRGFGGPGFDGFGFWSSGFFWAIILVGLGVLLFRRAETAPVPPGEAGQALSTAAVYPPGRPPRPPSILGRVTVAAGLLIVGLATLLENVGVFDLNARRFLGLLLVVVGAGLVVGAWWGRARWLITVGVLLIPILFVASYGPSISSGRSFGGEFGEFDDRTLRPTTLAEIASPIDIHNGRLTLDLTGLPLTTDPTQVTAEVGAGQIEVLVPDDVSVDVRAEVGAGMVDLFQDTRNGVGLDVRIEHPGPPDGRQLVLDLTAGFGEIVVRELAAGGLQPAGLFNPFEQQERI
ncbi:MAG: PspC domain-containing protein [Egibacteraceae bacterium]